MIRKTRILVLGGLIRAAYFIAAVVLLSATYAVSRRQSLFIFALSLSIISIGLTFWLAAMPASCRARR